MRVDLHQHVWPDGLVEALRRRVRPPRLDGWTLHLAAEPPFPVVPSDHDVAARAAQAGSDGVHLVGVSLSSGWGIEMLEPEQAQPLLDLWHDGAGAFGPPFAPWVSAALVEPDLGQIRRDLDRPGVLGLSLPAAGLATTSAVERVGEVLAVCADAGKPVLVHPGPVGWVEPEPGRAAPTWWPALVPYVAQQSAAWHAWHAAGRADHPTLRIAFVALAGLAPLHHERLAARGGAFTADPHVYYETSSYATGAVDAMVRVVGVDALVHGSDRPYAEPTVPRLGEAFTELLFTTNPAHLLTPERSSKAVPR